jgi:citrate lyase subunit beta/citryl-CoA lyase
MRSLLFAPANRADLIAKLARPGADAVAVDLEDGTPVAEKEAARAIAVAAIAELAKQQGVPQIFVRANTPDSPWFDGDLEAMVAAAIRGLEGFVIPKLESAPQLVSIERKLTTLERAAGMPPHTLILGLETGAGVEYATEILRASSRACAAYFGAEDYAADIGARRTRGSAEVAYARARVALSCRLAGVAAIDQAVVEVRDDERYTEDATVGRDLGYDGKLCVHPAQVALAHAAFSPSEEEVDRSRRLLAAYEQSLAEGRATTEFEGQMIDSPLVLRAQRTLDSMAS